MFLRNCWYVAGWSHHFPADKLIARTVIGDPIVLYRKQDGGVVALEDRCCHRLAPLSCGRLEGDDLRCMYHGLKFAPSGKCIEIPGQQTVPATAAVRAYPAVEQDCWVWLWMGDPARADRALIPRALGHDDPDWIMRAGELAYEANYELINDNLLDLTHLSYVHAKTLGRNSMAWGNSKPRTTKLERGLRIQRWVVNNPLAPYLGQPAGATTDSWQSYDYMVPGMFLLTSKFFAPGTAAACSMEPPGPEHEPFWTSLTSQPITPIGENQSIYYFSSCLSRKLATEAQADAQIALFRNAFAEDNAMIEAQQRVINLTPEPRMLGTMADGPLNLFRQLMAGLIAAEQPPGAAPPTAEKQRTRVRAAG
jgi:phenylpropionate dioxygenase-like ring-hydroxylating dioxygenase large terminal subunit